MSVCVLVSMMRAHMCMQCGKIVGVASPKTYLRPTNRDLHQGCVLGRSRPRYG